MACLWGGRPVSLIRLCLSQGRHRDLSRAGTPHRTYLKHTPGSPSRLKTPPTLPGYRWAWRRKLDQILLKCNVIQLVGAIGLFTLVLVGVTLAVSPGFRIFFATYRPGIAKLLGMEINPTPLSPTSQAKQDSSVKRDLHDIARSTEAKPDAQASD